VKLIDWGCGAAISDDLLPNAGSRAIRSIEMLIGYRGYRTAGDLWAVGCLIFGVLCHGEVPWHAATASDALVELARYVGAGIIVELAGKYDKELPTETVKAMRKVRPKRFADDFSFRMRRMRDPELIDLMIKLLAVNIEDRLTVDQALQHPFFAQE
jgi:serine/threonine protein kinase